MTLVLRDYLRHWVFFYYATKEQNVIHIGLLSKVYIVNLIFLYIISRVGEMYALLRLSLSETKPYYQEVTNTTCRINLQYLMSM